MPLTAEKRKRYPKDWRRRSYFVRYVRARGRCEWCGAEEGKPHPITGARVVLTTAHVWDKRPESASLLNLAALCQLCHNRHDAPDRARARAKQPNAQPNGALEAWQPSIFEPPARAERRFERWRRKTWRRACARKRENASG